MKLMDALNHLRFLSWQVWDKMLFLKIGGAIWTTFIYDILKLLKFFRRKFLTRKITFNNNIVFKNIIIV